MPLNREEKQLIVAEVAQVASESISSAAAFYSGLTVKQMTELRVKARAADIYLRVVRNTLARRAVENTAFACMQEKLVGPIILAFSKNEPSAPARLMQEFAKENAKLQVTALAIGGKLFGSEQLDALAKLPTYPEAISMLMSVMKAPITQFVQTLAAPHTKLVRTLAAVRDQKQAA